MTRCRVGELVYVDTKAFNGICSCYLGLPFVTAKYRFIGSELFWMLPRHELPCIHLVNRNMTGHVVMMADRMCCPIRPRTSMHQPIK